jgi:O-methyltransferase
MGIIHKLFYNKNTINLFFKRRVVILERVVNQIILHDFTKNNRSEEFFYINNLDFKEEFQHIMKHFSNSTSENEQQIIFLEFGVLEGKSINIASKINKHQNSIFIGFDSFEGLPENWQKSHPKGYFNVDGKLPKINDLRVSFVKGWFTDTIDEFLPKLNSIIENNKKAKIIINMDADLFSSTSYVLSKLEKYIQSDVIIRFDEFGELTDNSEFCAFYNFVRTYNKSFEILFSDKWNRHVVLKIN